MDLRVHEYLDVIVVNARRVRDPPQFAVDEDFAKIGISAQSRNTTNVGEQAIKGSILVKTFGFSVEFIFDLIIIAKGGCICLARKVYQNYLLL